MTKRYLEFTFDRAHQTRWRLKASNGKIVAVSGEGYKRHKDCVAIAKKLFPTAVIR